MKKTKIVFFALFVGFILLSLGGCLEDKTYTIKYQIVGQSSIALNVRYANETEDMIEIHNVPIPLEKTITVTTSTGFLASCSVSLETGNSGIYTVIIFVDDKEVKQTSGRDYVYAGYIIDY